MNLDSLKRIKPLCITENDSTKLMDNNVNFSALINGIDCLFYISNEKTLLYEKSRNVEVRLARRGEVQGNTFTIFDATYIPELKLIFIHDCFYLYNQCMMSQKFDTRYRTMIEFLQKGIIVKEYKVLLNKVISFTHLLHDENKEMSTFKQLWLSEMQLHTTGFTPSLIGGVYFKNMCFQYYGNFNVYSFGNYVLPDKYYVNLRIKNGELYVYDSLKRKEKPFHLFGNRASSTIQFRYLDTMYNDFDSFADLNEAIVKKINGLVCRFFFVNDNVYQCVLALCINDFYTDTVSNQIIDELSALYIYDRYSSRLDISKLNYGYQNNKECLDEHGVSIPKPFGMNESESVFPNWVPSDKRLYYKELLVEKYIPINQFLSKGKLEFDTIDINYYHIENIKECFGDFRFYYNFKNDIQSMLDAGELIYKYNLLNSTTTECFVYDDKYDNQFKRSINSFKFKRANGREDIDSASQRLLKPSDLNSKYVIPKDFKKFRINQERKGNFDLKCIINRWNKYILLRTNAPTYTPYYNRSFRVYYDTSVKRQNQNNTNPRYKQITKKFKKEFRYWKLVIEFVDRVNQRYLSNTKCNVKLVRVADRPVGAADPKGLADRGEAEPVDIGQVNIELEHIIRDVLTFTF